MTLEFGINWQIRPIIGIAGYPPQKWHILARVYKATDI
jgi:hypothetical protein